jgi:hypothetical protein
MNALTSANAEGMNVGQSNVGEGMVELQNEPKNLINKEDIKNDIKPLRLTVLEYGWLLKGKAGD